MQSQTVSRRDFLKFCSLVLGGLTLPRDLARASYTLGTNPGETPSTSTPIHFQWQNEFLHKVIYPMREKKLRDFLIDYQEVDIWAQYKHQDVTDLPGLVDEYKKEWKSIMAVAQQEYIGLRDYFLKGDVRAQYSAFGAIDEQELGEIKSLHALFVQSWPKDIRGELGVVNGLRERWKHDCSRIGERIKVLERRHESMDPAHPKYVKEGEELVFKDTITLPMAELELDRFDAFLKTYEKLEERKLAWYKLTKSNPKPGMSEEEFIETFPAERQVTIADLARWLADKYSKSLADKNQYELLDLINQRFQREPGRFPPWLRYMVIHFSGMRYASAHGSWADPKDLLVRLHAQAIDEQIDALDDAAVQKMCTQKLAAYGSTGSMRPALAEAHEQKWKDELHWYLSDMKANGPKTRRSALTNLLKAEDAYELMGKSIQQIHDMLLAMKRNLHPWIWHEIVRLTDLRVTQAADPHWEILPPQEVAEELLEPSNNHLRTIIRDWEHLHTSAWRDEHGRTLELIVTRAVCNEAAEHCQHVRGHLPPGGLTPKPKWYRDHETKGDLPGAYFIKPTSEKDYTQGASIFWLRFVDKKPDAWQVAKNIDTKQKVGLLPAEFLKRTAQDLGVWVYTRGETITRTRTTILPDETKAVERQWLRWIHEATVAEVAETVDGMMVITFETSLPNDAHDTSSVGIHKMPLSWHLADGKEDAYNRSFVGYVPDGQTPFEPLKRMLDWKRIFRQQIQGPEFV